MKHFYYATILLFICACSGRQTTRTTDENDSDSIAPVLTLEQLTLPDTMYESATDVYYVIESADTTEALLTDYDDAYADRSQIRTFRGNGRRDADFGGRVDGTPDTVEVAWCFQTAASAPTTSHGTWGGGSGWTGQPLFNGKEIIVGSLCGRVYFIDYESGEASREPYDAGNVVKGTMSLDPQLNNLYVGQGVAYNSSFGCELFDTDANRRSWFFDRDPHAWRSWGAYDSSPIVHGGYLFWPGENGSIYKYQRTQGELRRVAVMRYKVAGAAPGIESSMCVYRNYGFTADNHGNIICTNLNTMRPVWHYNNHDDSDGTIVCLEEDGTPYLYAGCEVDKQGMSGTCHFVKLRALGGSLVWDCQIPCSRINLGEKTLDGGMYSTPLPGSGDCDSLMFINVCRNHSAPTNGELIAVRKSDGTVAFSVPLRQWAWSSPIPFHNEQGEMFIFTVDAGGNIYLLRGRDGSVLYTRQLPNALFESSPIAIRNTAVVGSRGNVIYKFIIK